MEKKYYELIVELVKKHKKYPQYEMILEDIVNDVYEHSKVVITSISNEDVLTAYLNKVISTSMITVPKKMNIQKVASHKEFNLQELEYKEKSLVNLKDNYQEDVSIEKNDDVVSENYLEERLENEVVVLEEPKEDSIKDEIIEQPIADSDSFDKTLVDNLINGIPSSSLNSEIENLDEIEVEYVSENEEFLIENNIENFEPENLELAETEIEEENLEEKADVVLSTEIEEDEEEVFVEDEVEALILSEENPESFDILESVDEIDANSLEFKDEKDNELDINSDLNLEEDNVEFLDSYKENDFLENSTTNDDLSSAIDLSENNQKDLEEDVEFLNEPEDVILDIGENTEIGMNLDEDSQEVEKFEPEKVSEISYKCFYFKPNNLEFDKEEILKELQDFDEKYPNKRIFEICDLKYNKNLSVSEIADNMCLDLTDVISILNEIVDIMKD